jgi:hypothetical protein
MAAKVSEVERFEGADFGAGRALVFATEVDGDVLGDVLKDGNFRDVPGMGCLQFGEPTPDKCNPFMVDTSKAVEVSPSPKSWSPKSRSLKSRSLKSRSSGLTRRSDAVKRKTPRGRLRRGVLPHSTYFATCFQVNPQPAD